MFTKLLFPNYKIGRWTYGSPKVLSWGEGAALEIGAFCSIAKGVKIFLGGEHRTDWITTYPFGVIWKRNEITGHPSTKGDVIIGNDVWLAEDCTILSGVIIGDGAVVGAGAVVVQDVPPYSIVFGNPARVMRYRFDKNTILSLLEIKWWNWSDEKITDNLPLLSNSDIATFIESALDIQGNSEI